MTTFLSFIFLTMLVFGTSAARRSYTAAAFEHARFGKRSDPQKLVIETNLALYTRAAEIASVKGADIIVYPEYGLYFQGNRTQLKGYLEETPDPKKIHTNPCDEKEAYSQKPILHTLSCIAKNNSIVVVANTGSFSNCSGERDCPVDGVFNFNTNVVFDKDGTLLLRYYKEHLFLEPGMDLPREQQDPTFKTDFGTFATYICFDIIFKRMSEVAKWPQVNGVMFSTMWADYRPQYVSVALWEGWAMGNNVTLVAANIQIPEYSAVGSGIFYGLYGSLGYTFNPDGISKLLVAEIPISGAPILPSKHSVTAITKNKAWDWKNDGKNVPKVCSSSLLNETIDIKYNYRCYDDNTANYTLVKLIKSSGIVKACNNGMCCSVNYSTEVMSQDFYLGVYNGTYNSHNRYFWCEESCFIARCDAVEGQACSTFPLRSNTIFHHVEILSNFSTQYIYPSVIDSKMRLVLQTHWKYNVVQKTGYESRIDFRSKNGKKLIAVGFKARCYDRDPLYGG